MQNLEKLKIEIVEVGNRLYQRNFIAANNGNISCRLGKDKILITPGGVNKGFMKAEDLVITDMEGKLLAGHCKPSSEILMHLTIYKNRFDVQSVCHAHPVFATTFACSKKSINSPLLADIIIGMGKIAEIKFAAPGSRKLSENLLPYLKEYDVFLLANHGAVTVANSITSAHNKMQSLEQYAHIRFLVEQLGNSDQLNKEQIQDLIQLRKKFAVRKGLNKFE